MRMITRRLLDVPSLRYDVETEPSPLQASPMDPTDPLTTATLTVIASNRPYHATVNVKSVSIEFDVAAPGHADGASYLTSIGTGIDFQVMGDPDQEVWTRTNNNAGILTATAKAGSVAVAGEGLAFILSNIQPNRSVGTVELTITETLDGGDGNDVVLLVSKFPHQFAIGNLRADAYMIPYATGTTLRWDGGDGATLTLLGYGQGPVDVTGKTSWPPVTDPMVLTENTEFVLQARVGTIALATWSILIEVERQSLGLNHLTVWRSANLLGDTQIGYPAADAVLTIYGNANATGWVDGAVGRFSERLIAQRTTALQGDTIIGAAGFPARLTVHGDTEFDGSIAAKAATFSERLTANGGTGVKNGLTTDSLTVQGAVALLGGAMAMDEGTHQVFSDGFLVGCVGNPGILDGSHATYLSLSSGGMAVSCVGGNMALGWNVVDSNDGSAILPVRNGATCTISTFQPDDSLPAPVSIWWVPLGLNTAMPTQVQAADGADGAMAARAERMASAAAASRERVTDGLVAAIGGLFDKPLSAKKRDRLRRALSPLVGGPAKPPSAG